MEKLWTKSESKQWCWTLFAGTLTVYAARVALPICAVPVSKEYKWSKTDSGSVLSSFFWGYASTQILGGHLADRYGGENVLAVSTLVWSFITLVTPSLFEMVYSITDNPIPLLVAVRIAMGVSQGFHFPCLASIVSRHLTSAEKGRVFGIVTAGSHAGTVICGSVGSLILDSHGWRSVFHFIGLLGILWWLLLRRLSVHGGLINRRRLSSNSDKSAVDKASLLPLILPTAVKNSPNNSSSASITKSISNGSVVNTDKGQLPTVTVSRQASSNVPWLTLFKRPPFWAAICAHYCGANAYFTMFSWLPSYFSENYPGANGWVFNVIPNIAIVTTSMLAPPLSMRLIGRGYSVTNVRKLMEGGSLFGLALCLMIVSQIDSYQAALSLFSVAMAFRGFHHAGVTVNPQDFAPNHTGAVFGFLNTAGAIPGFIGVYVAGYILQLTQNWAYVFGVTAIQCLIGAAIYGTFATAKQII